MFDFDAGKFLIIGIVALIVIGPKELPRVLRQVGQTVGRVRRMAAEFQGQFMDAMKEADLATIRDDLKKIGNETHADLHTHFDPARDIQRELTASLESPAVAATVPAMVEGDGIASQFALPPVDHGFEVATVEPEIGSATVAAAGLAPVVDDDRPVALDHGAPALDRSPADPGVPHNLAKKRKIVVTKRGGLAVRRAHAVSDRTAIERFRPLRPRGQEIAQR